MKNSLVAFAVLGSAAALTSCSDGRGPSSNLVPSFGDSTGDSATEDAPEGTCGDGVVDPGETCDPSDLGDGNAEKPSPVQMPQSESTTGTVTEGPAVVEGIDGSDGAAGGDAPATADDPESSDVPESIEEPVEPAVVCDESAIITDSPNTLTVDVDAAQQLVHKEIFGVLMETLGRDVNGGIYVGRGSNIPNTDGLRNDIIQGFRDAGVGIVQWPGGCAANNYNWEPNTNPANTMGTDLFMEFCEAIDAEPYLTGRPDDAFAQSNRRWIEYVNDNPDHPEWNLKYFKVGNEVWGCGGNLGHDAQALAQYRTWYDANYSLLNAPVNGKELFLVGATAGIWTVNPNTDNWLTLMVQPQSLGPRIDGIEIHDYLYYPEAAGNPVPNVGFSDNQYYDIVNMANRGQMAQRIDDIRTILDRQDPQGRIKIVEDEWGDWLVGFNENQDTWLQQGTLMDAISAGETLHVFMENADRVQAAALAQPVNVIHSLFLTRPGDGVLVKTPTFYLFQMFRPHHTANARWAPSSLDSQNIQANGRSFPVLSSAVTVDDAGGVNVSLINVDLVNARSIDVSLNGSTAAYALASARVLTGPAKDSYNDFGQPESVNTQTLDASSYQFCGRSLSITLPPKSVVTLRLDPQ